MNAPVKLTLKDFSTDQEVRWCPGCGDYAILKTIQKLMPELDTPKENTVFVSGIGCSSRFPYYMETYGFHTIHGRAPAIATGVKLSNPELRCLDGYWGWRWSEHWRQSHAACLAPECGSTNSVV